MERSSIFEQSLLWQRDNFVIGPVRKLWKPKIHTDETKAIGEL